MSYQEGDSYHTRPLTRYTVDRSLKQAEYTGQGMYEADQLASIKVLVKATCISTDQTGFRWMSRANCLSC